MLSVDHAPGLVTLTLERPEKGNALCPELVEALITELARACAVGSVHTVVLATSGQNFCTGLDLSEIAHLSDGDLLQRLVRIETLLAMLWHAPLRTVAVSRGRTWGAGADLFAACELRVAAPGSRFRFPGAQFGIVLGTRRLAERIGADAARHVVLTGGELDAAQALACGLANQVAQTVDLEVPLVDAASARAIRVATRADLRDADLAALVRSAAEPGLRERITRYRERMSASPAH
jgi:enoyl-CoA hydratase/carnithine racemase